MQRLLVAEVRVGRAESRDHQRGEDRHKDQQHQEGEGEERQAILAKAPPEELPRRSCADVERPEPGEFGACPDGDRLFGNVNGSHWLS